MQTAPPPTEIEVSRSSNGQYKEDAKRSGLGIYKFGQGYWVRVMTAVFAGVLVLSCALWASNRLSVISIPVSHWTGAITRVEGTVAGGAELTLLKGKDKLGTAKVDSFTSEAGAGTLRFKDVTTEKGKTILDADRVQAGAFTAQMARPQATYIFERSYLQLGGGLLIVVAGALVIYRLVGTKVGTVDFLIATDGEMKKVNWSTRKIIQDSTTVVIGATFLIAGFIFLSDLVLNSLVQAMNLLGTN